MNPLLLALFAGAFLALFSGEQPNQDSGTDPDKPEIEVRVQVDRTTLISNEPLAVHVEITNVSDHAVEIPVAFAPDVGILTFKIWGPSDRLHRYEPFLFHADGEIPTRMLESGESLQHNVIIYYSVGKRTHFRRPGHYGFQAIFRPSLSSLEGSLTKSNVVSLVVTEPPRHSVRASRLFGDDDLATWAWGFSSDWQQARHFESLLKQNLDEPFAPWCHFFLADRWRRNSKAPVRERARNALHHYETLLKQYPEFPLAIEVEYQSAKQKWVLGDEVLGLRKIEKLIEAHPNLHFLQRTQRAIDGYKQANVEITPQILP